MREFLEASIEANKEIAKLIASNSHEFLCKELTLGAGGDISRRVDLKAEEIFIKYLQKFGNIHSEECGFVPGLAEFDIVVDPIDGSDNFASNFPYFGTSVALKYKNKCIAAVITNLANGDIFYKDKDLFQKANLDTLIFEDMKKNNIAKVGIFERVYRSKTIFGKLKKEKIKFRSPGAFALSLAYAHDVTFVVYEGDMRVYDVEAGLYMCDDLYKTTENGLLIISKDKEIFDRISQLFRKGE
ncbi:MAG: inositol monophosphatase family protein [Sulfurospirillum sp.]